jgi:hypothetical protein
MQENKKQRMACAQSILQQYSVIGEEFLESNDTEGETWFHHFTPKTKRASMEWKHLGSHYQKMKCLQVKWWLRYFGTTKAFCP